MAKLIITHPTKELIEEQFTEVVRNLMRGIAAVEGYEGGVYRATEKMTEMINSLEQLEEHISWRELFLKAVINIGHSEGEKDREFLTTRAAKQGMSYLAELTCTDNAAKGRISKKKYNFINTVHSLAQE